MGTSSEQRTHSMIRRVLGHTGRYVFDNFGIYLSFSAKRPKWPQRNSRFSYQQQYIDFDIKQGERVLDVGNGGDPFPYATILVDRFLDLNPTRREPLVTKNKPFALADIHHLPFADKTFDYVYCVHVLEVVENPLQACQELIRVGKRGFIETPTAGKDMLFAWARGVQKWHLVAIGRTLCFFEYSDRELDGIRSHAWRDLVFSSRRNPIQDAFQDNQDIFNVMFTWKDRFAVCVFRQDGTIQTLNTDVNNHSQTALGERVEAGSPCRCRDGL